MSRNGILGWFKWESKATRAKREKRFTLKMYPFGEEQRNWEIAKIKELFPKERTTQEVHFSLLTYREGLLNAQLDEDDDDYENLDSFLQYWKKSNIITYMEKKGYLPVIKALAHLENAAESLEELPTSEKILAEAENHKGK